MSGPTDADVRIVLQRFGLAAASAEPLGNRGGFSGARLWRIHTGRGDSCLKAWPPGSMSPRYHVGIADLVRCARDAGLTFVPLLKPTPEGLSCVEFADRFWDLAGWMPGAADFHDNPSPARLEAATVALARLHRVWERFRFQPEPCPAVIRRLFVADGWTYETARGARRPTFAAADPVSPWAERAWNIVVRHIPVVRWSLESWRLVDVPVQACQGDVWHDHVLFTGDEVTGLIDYGALKKDSVAADLARLLGSLVGDDLTLYELGLDAYASVRPLSDRERQLVPLLDRTGVILALATWLRRLYLLGEWPDDRLAVARRIADFVRRAESWASVEP
jgi:homoserine kinase type II